MTKPKHGLTMEVLERDSARKATLWLGSCGSQRTSHARWAKPTWQEVEDEWRKHVHEVTGTAPDAMGDTEGRWMP